MVGFTAIDNDDFTQKYVKCVG